jgi:hypothetical protein
MNAGTIFAAEACGVMTFDEPAISASPSGPMILPRPPKSAGAAVDHQVRSAGRRYSEHLHEETKD